MATFTKKTLSNSTDGKAVLVAATATAGTLIHTGSTTVTTLDEVWLYANNIHSSAVTLTVEFGGTTATSDLIQLLIPATPSGLYVVVAGLILRGTGSAATTITAFAGTASKIEIFGFVNRIT